MVRSHSRRVPLVPVLPRWVEVRGEGGGIFISYLNFLRADRLVERFAAGWEEGVHGICMSIWCPLKEAVHRDRHAAEWVGPVRSDGGRLLTF